MLQKSARGDRWVKSHEEDSAQLTVLAPPGGDVGRSRGYPGMTLNYGKPCMVHRDSSVIR